MATCHFCNLSSPRLYAVPEKSLRGRRVDGPACYFCYIKMTGIKPTRRKLVAASEVEGVAGVGE
jgi:hypothetical protein